MGRLHPADFPLNSLDDSERMVVEALIEFTDNSWIVMPTVRLAEKPPVEIDIVVAHPAFGVGIVEVKGFIPDIKYGQWITPYGNEGDGGPPAQLTRNRFALRDLLRRHCPVAPHVDVPGAVAFPNAKGFKTCQMQPHDLSPDQIIWSTDLTTIDDALTRAMPRGRAGVLMFPDGVFKELIDIIRPDVAFDDDPAAYARWAQRLIERNNGNHVKVLERLDVNRRVYVTGGAGTGKSRLAVAWAWRCATGRGERTLLVCFNEPLGFEFQRRLADVEGLTAGPFFPVARDFDGMPLLETPDERREDPDFWNNDVNGHLHLHWPQITERFDTIIVDEVQDFSPAWLAQLEALLDPDGPRRMLLVGDSDQELHPRGFIPPRSDDGWTLCELVRNTRNSYGIAQILRRRLKGPEAPQGGPESTHLRFRPLDDLDAPHLRAEVTAELEQLRSEGFEDEAIAVVCADSTSRNWLRESPQFCRWEHRGEGRIACETTRRIKGLEFSVVILVASKWPVEDQLLYVGVSRAVLGLSVVGPPEMGERLGLTPMAG